MSIVLPGAVRTQLLESLGTQFRTVIEDQQGGDIPDALLLKASQPYLVSLSQPALKALLKEISDPYTEKIVRKTALRDEDLQPTDELLDNDIYHLAQQDNNWTQTFNLSWDEVGRAVDDEIRHEGTGDPGVAGLEDSARVPFWKKRQERERWQREQEEQYHIYQEKLARMDTTLEMLRRAEISRQARKAAALAETQAENRHRRAQITQFSILVVTALGSLAAIIAVFQNAN